MNKWIKKSIEIANAPGYLDKLSKIYVMNVNPERPFDTAIEQSIQKAFKGRNTKNLINLLLEAEIFPVKDSYIGFIRAKKDSIDQNPKTVERIGERLYSLGLEKLLQEATRPKETNRQLGSAFRSWLPSLGHAVLDEDEFTGAKGVAFLSGSDKALKDYATKHLGCKLTKGIDTLFKKDKTYVIGEAKFLTTPGGEQNGGFADASKLIKSKSGSAKRIALIDGYIWLKSNKGIYNKIVKSDLDIFSALLLKDYIEVL
jgi:hypothetical protein